MQTVCHFQNNKLPTEPEKEDYKQHRASNQRAKEEKDNDKQLAKTQSDFKSITFDLQSILSTPCSLVSLKYYTKKIDIYNLTIYDQASKAGFCYVWEEYQGQRGSCAIGTCLDNYVASLPFDIRKISLFSDCCSGQNRNQFTAIALLNAVNKSENI